MTLRLNDEQARALRHRADREGRSVQQVALAAIDEYLCRAEDDESAELSPGHGSDRFADLLCRLGD